MMIDGLRGRVPVSFQERSGVRRFAASVVDPGIRSSEQPRTLPGARDLEVVRVVDETPNARSFVLRDPTGTAIDFVPGQFLTVEVMVDGKSLRRAYSISSLAGPELVVTIKRVVGGQVSNYLNDQLAVGETLRVFGPSGDFAASPSEVEGRLVCIAGGSGITPIMSILRAWVASGHAPQAILIYGNRDVRETIFAEELSQLGATAKNLHVHHVYSEPEAGWSGPTGILDVATLGNVLDEIGAIGSDDLFLSCGPEPMMEAVRACLKARGVAGQQLREELFAKPHLRTAPSARSLGPATVQIRVGEASQTVEARGGQTLLEAGLDAGLAMPFSCAMGGCGACRVKLVEGEVLMEEPNCLTPEERSQNYVLACIGRACGPCSIELEQG